MTQPTSDFDIQVTSLAYGGDAIGRLPDGRAVFVPYALPGETVRVRLVEEKRQYARAGLVEVLEPSVGRIVPRCPHFTVCGGCHYQHIPYPLQLDIKAQIVREQLERIAGISKPPLGSRISSPEEWNYRNYVQFHLDPHGKLGFQKSHSNEVMVVRECHLPEDLINRVWPSLDLDPESGVQRVSVRAGAFEDILITLEGKGEELPACSIEGLPVSVVYLAKNQKTVMAGEDTILEEILGRSFRVSAGSFFQVNRSQASSLVETLLSRIEWADIKVILELFSGVGLFSAFLAGKASKLVCVESSESACEDFCVNLDDFDNVELYQATVEGILQHIDLKPDLILADPPRRGLGKGIVESINRLSPLRVVYFSCDVGTMARDARYLRQIGYQLEELTTFDLFPQTYHIETMSIWGR